MKKLKEIKRKKAYYKYKFNKRFYREFGRKPFILLTKAKRKKHKSIRKKAKLKMKREPIVITLPSVLSLDNEYRKEFLEKMEEINKYLPSSKSFIY